MNNNNNIIKINRDMIIGENDINLLPLNIIEGRSFRIKKNKMSFGITKDGYFIKIKGPDIDFFELYQRSFNLKRSLKRTKKELNKITHSSRVGHRKLDDFAAEEYEKIKAQSALSYVFNSNCFYLLEKKTESFEFENLIAISVKSNSRGLVTEVLDSRPDEEMLSLIRTSIIIKK